MAREREFHFSFECGLRFIARRAYCRSAVRYDAVLRMQRRGCSLSRWRNFIYCLEAAV